MLRANLFFGLGVLALACMAQPSIDWQRNLGGGAFDIPWSIDRTVDGGVIVAGETGSTNNDVLCLHGGQDVWVVKLDAEGILEWQRCLGGTNDDKGRCIRRTGDGGSVLCGVTASVDGDVSALNGAMDIWVVKLSASGEIEWEHSYGGSDMEEGRAIVELPSGEFYLFAETFSSDAPMADSHGPRDIWLARLAATGDMIWSRSYGGSDDETARDMAILEDGSVVLVGSTRSQDGDVSGIHGQGSNLQPDVWVLKVAATGEPVWQHCLGGDGLDTGWGVSVAPNGKIYVAATSNSTNGDVSDPHGDWDYWITRLSSDGVFEIERSFGGFSVDQVQAITSTASNEILVTGGSASNDGDITAPLGVGDAWTIKLDQDLELIWERCFGGTLTDTGRGIHWAQNAAITFIAYSASSDGDLTGNHGLSDFWVVKLHPEDVGVAEALQENGLTVFPNPANDHIRIAWPDLDIRSVEVYDARGRKVATEAVGQRGLRQVDLDVSTWSDGLYMVSVQHGTGLLSQRFVKH